MMWRIWLANTLVKRFRRLGKFGWFRFQITRIGYKMLWPSSPRNGEWDYVLQWLPYLEPWQERPEVLDVGCSESLFIYEIKHRGYRVSGLDQRDYQEELPLVIAFHKMDISKMYHYFYMFDFIVAISTIEHIGMGAYGDSRCNDGDKKALENIAKMLRDNGYLIITVPGKHWGTDNGKAYSYRQFNDMVSDIYHIVNFQERNGQICAVLVKKP